MIKNRYNPAVLELKFLQNKNLQIKTLSTHHLGTDKNIIFPHKFFTESFSKYHIFYYLIFIL